MYGMVICMVELYVYGMVICMVWLYGYMCGRVIKAKDVRVNNPSVIK